MTTNHIEIKQLTTADALKDMQQLEKRVWNMAAIPTHQTYTAVKNGGIVLAAYDGNNPVGFTYGFPGFKNKFTYLCSHMLGIHPEYQGEGLGCQLKQAQRQLAEEMGYSVITWTFDPLESLNAYFNLHKLRGIAVEGFNNHYGEMNDELNSGLPTDRFLVEWRIGSQYIEKRQNDKKKQAFDAKLSLLSVKLQTSGLTASEFLPMDQRVELGDSSTWFVPIPNQFQEMKRKDITLAKDWRLKTREVFNELFNHDFVGTDVIHAPNLDSYYYVFNKKNALEVEDKYGTTTN